MFRKGGLIVFVIVLAFVGFGLFGDQLVEAQQSPAAKTAPTVTPTPPIDEEDEVVKVETESVNVLFTAQDRNRKLILNLKPEDIRILENGQPQTISAFTRQIDLPLSLSILIDTSISQERTLPEEKAAAISFLEAVIRPAKDEVSVVSFTGESTLEQGMTNNLNRLRRAIERVEFVPPSGYIGGGVIVSGRNGTPPISGTNQQIQGSTAIWDSLWITSSDVLGPAPEKTRRAIILLSDGVDTSSKKKLDEAVLAAQRAEAVIYSIGIGDNFYDGVDEAALKKVSERTGGRAYFPRDENELRQAFRQIQDEMRSQYLIAYEPTNRALDGSYRKIEIQVASPALEKEKVRITHRQGYFAKAQGGNKK
ncbi:MAG TPA: VWA domain-containing protein [Pyrinomonadaceae bacterium]|nr:VWA domain-containing protein [Pyrinomonadaceae bacterium]